MSKITQKIDLYDETKLPYEGKDVAANAIYSFEHFAKTIKQWNVAFTQANKAIDFINLANNNVSSKYATVTKKHKETVEAAANAQAAKNAVLGFVIPNEAINKQRLETNKKGVLDSAFNAFGYTKRVLAEDRFKEVNTANTLIDKRGGFVRFSDGLYKIDKDTSISFPHAPFASDTDELLNDSVHGLTCQKSHNRGNIVATGINRFTGKNTNSNNWIDSGDNSYTATNGGAWDSLFSDSNFEENMTYIVSFEVESISGGNIRVDNGVNANYQTSEIGIHTCKIKVAHNKQLKICTYGGSVNAVVKNISIVLEDNIYQAIRDTNKMFDLNLPDSGIFKYKEGEVHKYNGGGARGKIGHYYLREAESGTIDISLVDFATSFVDLGTAENMSLKNPYFKKIDVLKRQDILTIRKNKLSSKVDYYTFKGTHFFSADFSQKSVMEYYGFTNIDKNLWEDNDYEYVFVSLIDRLNAGAYHPVYNAFGTTKNMSGQDWFKNSKSTSIVDTLDEDRAAGTTVGKIIGGTVRNGRVDKKFYDKIYSYGTGGLIPSGGNLPYAGTEPPRLLEQETKNVHTQDGLEEGVVTYYKKVSNESSQSGVNTFIGNIHTKNVGITQEDFNNNFKDVEILFKFINTGYSLSAPYTFYKYYSLKRGELATASSWNNGSCLFLPNSTGSVNVSYELVVIRKKPYLLTYKDNLTIDILGDIQQYPQTWKGYLAWGKAIVGNVLLVDENGNSLIPDGTSKSPKGSKKYKNAYGRVYTSNKGQSYVRQVNAFDFGNKQTNIIANNAAIPKSELNLIFYTSFNSSLTINTPKEVLSSLDKVFITNNFNNLIVPIATNKIASALDFKSKYLENVEVGIPEHNNVNLTASSSAAIKYFCTLCKCEDGELGLQVFTQEIVPKNSVYNGDDNKFTSLTNTNILDLNNKKVKTKVLTKRLGIWNI